MSFIGVPTQFLDFGAVKFNKYPKAIPCTTNATFCQPTEQDDTIAFQFIASESDELITNGSFNDSNVWNGWLTSFGVSIKDNEVCNWQSVNGLIQENVFVLNGYYKVTVTITNYVKGSLLAYSSTGGINQGIISVNAQGNGTFESYFTNTTGGTNLLLLGFADFDGCVSFVSVKQITDDYTTQIIDENSSVLTSFTTLRKSKNVITVEFKWSDLGIANGCRNIRVLDTTKVFEDNFSSNQGWTLGSEVTISGNDMTFLDTGAGCLAPSGFDCGAYIKTLEVGRSYDVTFTTKNGTGASVTLFAGDTQGVLRTTNNTFTETIVCSGNGRLGFYFIGALGQILELDDISIIHTNNIDGQSECYDLQTSHDCSLLFEWYNFESWGKYDYSTPSGEDLPFRQRLRLISKFRGTKYPSTKLIGEDSAGVKSLDYTSLRKRHILDVDFAPDYIHDALASMFMQDSRMIGSRSFLLDDDYEPSSPSDSRVLFKDMMTVRLELEETIQADLINRQ